MKKTDSFSFKNSSSKKSKIIAAWAALIVAGGGYALVTSRAAGFSASIDPTTATVSGNATLSNDASLGQKVLQFNAPATTPPPVTPPATADRPSASNTGYAAGTVFKNYAGAAYNSSDTGVTYDGVNFPKPSSGYYTFTGNNLTFRNCKFNGGVQFNGDNIRFENCEVIGGIGLSSTTNVVIQNNNIHDFEDDGLDITSDNSSKPQAGNITVAHNYVHKPVPTGMAHSDGTQVRGVNGLTYTNNTFDMGPRLVIGGQDPLNSALFLENANGGNSNVVVSGNYLNGGGYTVYLYHVSGSKFINNHFGPASFFGFVENTSLKVGDFTDTSGNVNDVTGAAINII
jgi:hypothetical protein